MHLIILFLNLIVYFNSIKVQLERYNGAFCFGLKSISIP